MLVQCINNKISGIEDAELREHAMKFVRSSSVDLQLGQRYVVYGLVFWDGIPWYYVCDPDMPEYPVPQFSGFFKILDPTFPKSWQLRWPRVVSQSTEIVPKEWAETPSFYERLVDGNRSELQLFRDMKMGLDAEAGS